jgi:outer membrane immunogenic protein
MSFSFTTTKENPMKKILIAAAVAASFVAPQAFAQANGFTGFSAGANVNANTSSTEVRNGSGTIDMGKSSQDVSLQAAYGFDLGHNYVLGVGATYNLGDLKYGSTTGANLKGKDAYSLYVEPGYAFTNSTLVYAKLAYLGMKGEADGIGSRDFAGVGYGVGVRHKLSSNLFLQGEITQSEYSSSTIGNTRFEPSGTTGTVGVGYQF